jgi:UDP-N-acetyl-D-mannosaminouronate:lipid I N-acetyl-D-mannosaminouronosyltransferase
MKPCEINGIPIVSLPSMESAVELVFSSFDNSVIPGFAIAINPEKVMKARADKLIMNLILSATLCFADGIGVVWALRRKGAREVVRIPGCELWEVLMREAGKFGQPVFLIGSKPNVLSKVRSKLSSDFNVSIVGVKDGYFSANEEDELITNIRSSKAKIVTVAMGSPKQELFIQKCRASYPNAFYMGVGGTYDVYVGNVLRAPAWACRCNIEWFYRLAIQPTRISRQLVLFKFLLLTLFRRL